MTGWLAILQPPVLSGRLEKSSALAALLPRGTLAKEMLAAGGACHPHLFLISAAMVMKALLDIGCVLGTGLQEGDGQSHLQKPAAPMRAWGHDH